MCVNIKHGTSELITMAHNLLRTTTTTQSKLFASDSRKSSNFFFVLIKFAFRYASLYFCCAIEQNDNELLTLEIIHRYVELLDKYFGSVSIKNHILSYSGASRIFYSHLLINLCVFFCWAGVRARHHFQLWKGIFHTGWIVDWRWNARNVQKECAESDCRPRCTPRGQYTWWYVWLISPKKRNL